MTVEEQQQSNLEPCPECGQDVSPKAPTCPNCGAPIASEPEPTEASRGISIEEPPETRWGAAFGGGFLIFLFASFNMGYLVGSDAGAGLAILAGIIGGYWVSKSGFKAWARTWTVCAILTFTVPISASIALATGRIGTAGGAEALGAGLGVAALGFLAFFVGTALAIVSYYTHKSANEKQDKLEAAQA